MNCKIIKSKIKIKIGRKIMNNNTTLGAFKKRFLEN
jgi:hypothetical protein